MALIEKLEAIGNAIRAKTGKNEKLSLDQMPSEIASIESGGGGEENSIEKYFEAQYAEVVLPNIKSIKPKLFYNDTKLTNIIMPKVKSIGGSAFYSCKNLALTSLPNGLTEIGNSAFSDCKNLALTSLPSGAIQIYDYAFSGCSNLALTSLPDGITNIRDYVFQNCSNLALTSLPNNLETIGSRSFPGCKNTFTSFPSSLKSIGARAFYYNSSLTSLTFKGTPTSISNNAFDSCSNLTTINVPWAEGAVANAPWGATNATINYNYTGG